MDDDVKISAAKRIIESSKRRLKVELENENWSTAGDIETYISGMRQILIVFTGYNEDGLPKSD